MVSILLNPHRLPGDALKGTLCQQAFELPRKTWPVFLCADLTLVGQGGGSAMLKGVVERMRTVCGLFSPRGNQEEQTSRISVINECVCLCVCVSF